MNENNYLGIQDCVDLLKVYAQLSVEEMKLLLPAINQRYKEAAIVITGIKLSEKIGYEDLASLIDRSVSHVRKVVQVLVASDFPLALSEDYFEYTGKGKPRTLVELKFTETRELEGEEDLGINGMDSELDTWLKREADKVGLSKAEFLCSAIALFKARQDNDSMIRLKEKYSKEAQATLMLY